MHLDDDVLVAENVHKIRLLVVDHNPPELPAGAVRSFVSGAG